MCVCVCVCVCTAPSLKPHTPSFPCKRLHHAMGTSERVQCVTRLNNGCEGDHGKRGTNAVYFCLTVQTMTIDHKIPVSEHIYTNCKGLFYCLPNKFLLETLKIQRPFSFTKLKKISHSKYPISIHPSEKITLACITWLFFSHLAGPDGFFNPCTHHYARTTLMQGFPVGARVINKLYMKKS